MTTKVLVLVAIDPRNEADLQVVIVVRLHGTAMISEIVTLEGAAANRNGNPYLVYGDAVTAFSGLDKFDTSITVADCRSGDLSDWD
jgi:hypothetical protein